MELASISSSFRLLGTRSCTPILKYIWTEKEWITSLYIGARGDHVAATCRLPLFWVYSMGTRITSAASAGYLRTDYPPRC